MSLLKFEYSPSTGEIVLKIPAVALQELITEARNHVDADELIADKVEVKDFAAFAQEIVDHLNQNTMQGDDDEPQHSEIREIRDLGIIRHAIFSSVNDVVERGSSHLYYEDEAKGCDDESDSEPFIMNK